MASTAVGRGLPHGQETLADLPEVLQIWPTGGKFYDHAACGLSHTRGDFDQPRPPRAWLTLAQRIHSESAVAHPAGEPEREPASAAVVTDRMVALTRLGRAGGAGFYEYEDGARTRSEPAATGPGTKK